MTDANESADAGTSGAANGGADQGSNSAANDPFAGLETGTREWIGTKGYKSVGDLAKAAQNAESLIGKSVQLPGADAKPEDWQKVFRRLGAPETPDGYTLALPEGVAEGVIDAEFGTKFKDVAVKAGLTPSQAKAVHDFIALGTVEQVQANANAQAEAATKATEALEKAWGGKVGSEPFNGALQHAMRAINGLGGDDLTKALIAKGVLSAPDAEGNSSILDDKIAVAFSEIGKRYFTGAGFVPSDGPGSVDNPFAGEREKLNWSAVHKAIKADRQGALILIRAAGKKPSDFGLADAA